MSKENIRKWVDALRSGEYKQTTGQLRNGDVGFCCLGVACDLYGKENDVSWGGDNSFIRHMDLPPLVVRDWLGVGDNNPVLARLTYDHFGRLEEHVVTPGGNSLIGDVGLRASELNDDYGWTFEQLADAIEATYLI